MASNIEKFDMTVVLVLAELYTRFPTRKALLSRDFILTDEGEHIEGLSPIDESFLDSNDPYHKRKQFAFDSMKWLVEAGYIHGTPSAYDCIEGAVLTAKGLETLRTVPDSLQGSLGERLQDAAKKGIGAAVGGIVGQVVTLAAKLLV